MVEVILAVGIATVIAGPVLTWAMFAVDHERRSGDRLDATNGTALLMSWFGRDVPRAAAVVLDGGSPCAGSATAGGTEHVTLIGGIADPQARAYVEVVDSGGDVPSRSLWRRECGAGGALLGEVELFSAVEAGTTSVRCLPGTGAEPCTEVELRTLPRGAPETVVARAARRVDTAATAPVAGNRPPRAVITASATSGGYPLTVSFEGAEGTDPEGGALTYDWEFPGGVLQTGRTPPPHTFTEPGSYAVILTVTDPGGASHTQYVTVEVTNQPPVAAATASPQAGTIETVFTFDARASVDPEEPAPALYRWNFGGGVVRETTSPEIQYQFPGGSTLGARVVALTVVDRFGAIGETAVQVSLEGRPPGVAAITFDPGRRVTVGTTLRLGVDAADPDGGGIDAWEWRLLTTPTETVSGQEVFTVPALPPGTYEVRVRVRDGSGEWSPELADSFTVAPAKPAKPTWSTWRINWSAVAGASSYELEVNENSFCANRTRAWSFPSALSFTYPDPCIWGGWWYDARVRVTVNGVASDWSDWSRRP